MGIYLVQDFGCTTSLVPVFPEHNVVYQSSSLKKYECAHDVSAGSKTRRVRVSHSHLTHFHASSIQTRRGLASYVLYST
jgi:hypothetical protein